MEEWEIRVTHEFLAWAETLDAGSYDQITAAIDRLAEDGQERQDEERNR
ncbi:hypothetical protein [Actinoplanes lobatus]|uniref:Uncharacterized protein n=1 Tax=Actinoplanes lobatus TaxID=113568 RepID=A0A7W7HAM0_9ACTN|nr:hypothetical protein [Actinoplanes lobatus]MBB4747085.1 hypothetical protein [Actinoplanes lobatus]